MSLSLRDPAIRLTRVCDYCGQVDDHPHIITQHEDGTVQSGHHDCAALDGHPVAAAIIAQVGDATGPDLVELLTSGEVTV